MEWGSTVSGENGGDLFQNIIGIIPRMTRINKIWIVSAIPMENRVEECDTNTNSQLFI